ncbi:MAG: hypothetical protein ACPG7F_00930 [Aggregatilineales bacterium]
MANDDVSLNFGIDVDSAGADKARQELDRLEKAQLEVARAFAKGEIGVEESEKALKAYDKEIRGVRKNLKLLEKSQVEQAKAAEKAAKEQERLAKAQAKAQKEAAREAEKAAKAQEKAAERVAQARRKAVEEAANAPKERREEIADRAGAGSSKQAQVRGALEVLGGSAGESVTPLLEAGEGITDLAEVAVTTMGPAGLVVGAAAAGLALFVGNVAASFEEVNAIASSRLQAEEDIALRAANGTLSLSQAQEELGKTTTNLTTLNGLLKDAEDERASAFDKRVSELGGGLFGDVVTRIEETLGSSSALDEAIERRGAKVNEATGQQEAYTDAINSGKLASDDAAQSAKNSASAQDNVASAYDKASSASQSFERAAQTSAQSTERAADSIKGAFSGIEKQAGQLQSTFNSGLKKSSGKAFQVSLGGRKKKSSDSGTGELSEGGSDKAASDAKAAREKLADANQKYYEDLSKLTDDFNRETAKSNREAQDEIKRINTESRRSQADALRGRNFLELANAREERAEKINDFNEQRGIDRREQIIAFNEKKQALQKEINAVRQAEREKLKVQNEAHNASLTGWQAYFQNLNQLQAGATRGGQRSGQSSGGVGRSLRALTGNRRYGVTT